MLEQSPEIGRPASGTESLRELLIPFGHSGYVALYRFHPAEDIIYILAFRHQREAGY
ncbi:plasmid stabilization system protein ParE [Neorhizobium huautlense]|uniref:Plasmid stabilization system protein ParE n=2 Tax=Neorhizobium huautlense TaxID=67774 RepID=A0ABT9PUF7_9HYPH|nr:plasmid stabilization system protein ParE [Neorhizobium huautlense]